MHTQPNETDTGHDPNGSSAHPKGDSGGSVKRSGFARRARAVVTTLPVRLDGEMKRSPYVVLGVVGALGVAVGVVLSSRILRAVVTATATGAALELTRGYIRKNLWAEAS